MAKMVQQKYFQIVLAFLALCIPLVFGGCSKPVSRNSSTLAITPPGVVSDVLLKLAAPKDYVQLEARLCDGGMGVGYSKYWVGVVAMSDGNHILAESYFQQSLANRISLEYALSAKMSLGDVQFARLKYAEALAIYRDVDKKATGHTRFLVIARLCATHWILKQEQDANSNFMLWKEEFRNLTTAFSSSQQVAKCLKNDLSKSSVYMLQAGFFSIEELANQLKARIDSLGENASVLRESEGYRVIVGPYNGRREALQGSNKLRKHQIESFIKSWGTK